MMVARPQGESDPFCKPPVLKKLPGDSDGPAGITVRLKVWLNAPTAAVTVTGPLVPPACTVTCARPLVSVLTVAAERVPGPVIEKLTGLFETGWPVLPFTWTTRGCAKP